MDNIKNLFGKSQTQKQLDKYNNNEIIKDIHNCYAFFMDLVNNENVLKCQTKIKYEKIKQNKNYIRPCNVCNMKPSPGKVSGYKPLYDSDENYSCHVITPRVLDDIEGSYLVESNETPCKQGYTKGALVVAPNLIYHFYRQNEDGTWSHKDGSLEATNLDASNNKITDPLKANRNYGPDPRYRIDKPDGTHEDPILDYSDFCNYFCLPNNAAELYMQKLKLYNEKRRLENSNNNIQNGGRRKQNIKKNKKSKKSRKTNIKQYNNRKNNKQSKK